MTVVFPPRGPAFRCSPGFSFMGTSVLYALVILLTVGSMDTTLALQKGGSASLSESGPDRGAHLLPEPNPSTGASPMPELTPQSTSQPTPPMSNGEGAPPALPPVLDPAAWEDSAVFRETFLLYFTEPPANASLRVFGRLFHELVLEYYHHWPDWPEGATATELRAAVADLRHLQGYLGGVGREHVDAALTEPDTALSLLAARQAGELARIADEIEVALGRRA